MYIYSRTAPKYSSEVLCFCNFILLLHYIFIGKCITFFFILLYILINNIYLIAVVTSYLHIQILKTCNEYVKYDALLYNK